MSRFVDDAFTVLRYGRMANQLKCGDRKETGVGLREAPLCKDLG